MVRVVKVAEILPIIEPCGKERIAAHLEWGSGSRRTKQRLGLAAHYQQPKLFGDHSRTGVGLNCHMLETIPIWVLG